MAGLADTADSLGVIDHLIFKENKVTWDELMQALKANWKGYDNLRQLLYQRRTEIRHDDDYADEWAAFVMDTWYDSIDWINTQRELFPPWAAAMSARLSRVQTR